MKHFLRKILVLYFLLATHIPLISLSFWDEKPDEELADLLVSEMSLKERAAQVLMIGYPQETPNAETLTWAGERMIGGVKVFGWNATDPAKVAKAVSLLQNQASQSRLRVPLLIATDQEGGWVRHVKGTTSQSSGNLSIGASGLPYDAWMTGRNLALELRQMGINMNFAPSVDLFTNPKAYAIGPRTFSHDPIQAALLAMAFCRGSLSEGVIPTAKHFPGHGNTADDSHGRLPILDDDLETLRRRELVPYRLLIQEGLPCVMTGHLAFPKIAGNSLPATLNSALTKALLREELKFQGMIITDDLAMHGAKIPQLSLAETAIMALKAGNDMVLISQPTSGYLTVWETVAVTAQKDLLFATQLKQAASRVVLLKLRFLKNPRSVSFKPSSPALPVPENQQFFFQQTLRGVTIVKEQGLPLSAEEKVLVVSPYDKFFHAFRQRFPSASHWEYDYHYANWDASLGPSLIQAAAKTQRIVFHLTTPGSVNYLKLLKPYQNRVVVVCSLSPTPLLETPWVKTIVVIYGVYLDAFEAAAASLLGDFRPRGKLPLKAGLFHRGDRPL